MSTFPADQRPAAMVVPRFFVSQRITLMVDRYEIRVDADGWEGQRLDVHAEHDDP